MKLRNSSHSYGLVSILMHWIVTVAVFGLFALGFWMVDLTYYDDWYNKAPGLHESIGMLLLAVMTVRLVWRATTQSPGPLASHDRLEVIAGRLAHLGLYLLTFVVLVSGYLISTADGSSINVFDWFDVPSITGQIKGMEETAGEIHYWSTWSLIALAGLHALAALKHHFHDRDRTLKRMLSSR